MLAGLRTSIVQQAQPPQPPLALTQVALARNASCFFLHALPQWVLLIQLIIGIVIVLLFALVAQRNVVLIAEVIVAECITLTSRMSRVNAA